MLQNKPAKTEYFVFQVNKKPIFVLAFFMYDHLSQALHIHLNIKMKRRTVALNLVTLVNHCEFSTRIPFFIIALRTYDE